MSYFQTDDIPEYVNPTPKKLLVLVSPTGVIIFDGVQSHFIRSYCRNNYPQSGNAKRVWRSHLQSLGYVIKNK